MPKSALKFLEETFRASVVAMLIAENQEGRARLSRYILYDAFSLQKMTYLENICRVIYHSKMTPCHGVGWKRRRNGKNRKNFEVSEAPALIAAIT